LTGEASLYDGARKKGEGETRVQSPEDSEQAKREREQRAIRGKGPNCCWFTRALGGTGRYNIIMEKDLY
jgi:hypothetical protein